MPIDYSKYPPNWKDIVLVIAARAGEQRDRHGKITKEACCEWCGVENHDLGLRCVISGKFYNHDAFENGEDVIDSADIPGEQCIQIILTCAHLDHDAENHDVCVTRLAYLCQKCHNTYDAPMRRVKASYTRDARKGQEQLF